MKHIGALRGFVLGAVLMAFALPAWALGLGSLEGVPIIGRPLDVTIQFRPDEGMEASPLCMQAEVLEGDSRQIGGVSAQLESTGTPAVVRVRTFKPVQEPVVTVILHAGCTQPLTRRYVLLAELAADPVQLPQVPAALPRSVAAPRPDQPEAAASRRPLAVAARSSREIRPGAANAAAVRPAPRRESSGDGRLRRAAPKAADKPRLKLEALDLMLEPEPSLKLTLVMESRPGATPSDRANAAAVWKALSMTPEEQVQKLQQMQALDADLKSIRQQIVRDRSELGEVREQLHKSQSHLSAIVWGLSFAGVLLVAFMFYRPWERFRRPLTGPEWWHDSSGEHGAAPDTGPPRDERAQPGASQDLDVDLSQMDGSADELAPRRTAVTTSQPADFGPTDFKPSSLRSLNVEMQDLEQQADFFVSLGDYDRAVALLMSYVQSTPQPSELAWMALLDLHHRLNRQHGYEALRDQIERRFNVRIPAFERYHEPTAGLQSYADTLGRIVSLWPSPAALDVLEESIYRIPDAGDGGAFELEAYRELLLLYSVGKAVIGRSLQPDADATRPATLLGDLPLTRVQPPLALDRPGPPLEDGLPFATLDGGAPLDIDLDDLSQQAADESDGAKPTFSANLIDFSDFGAIPKADPLRENEGPSYRTK